MTSLSTVSHQTLTDNILRRTIKLILEKKDGFSEYDLLTHLNDNNCFPESITKNSSSLALFQKHFLIFHVLYLINDELIKSKTGSLKITPLLIIKMDYQDASSDIGHFDPMREYYLDLENFEAANEKNVNDLLNSFWEKFLRNDKRQDALSELDLADPVNDTEIKTQYRRLVTKHHPDKGGKTSKIQTINEAYKLLIKT